MLERFKGKAGRCGGSDEDGGAFCVRVHASFVLLQAGLEGYVWYFYGLCALGAQSANAIDKDSCISQGRHTCCVPQQCYLPQLVQAPIAALDDI